MPQPAPESTRLPILKTWAMLVIAPLACILILYFADLNNRYLPLILTQALIVLCTLLVICLLLLRFARLIQLTEYLWSRNAPVQSSAEYQKVPVEA